MVVIKRCGECFYSDVDLREEPCVNCFIRYIHPNFKPKKKVKRIMEISPKGSKVLTSYKETSLYKMGKKDTLKDIARIVRICHTEQDIKMLLEVIKEELEVKK